MRLLSSLICAPAVLVLLLSAPPCGDQPATPEAVERAVVLLCHTKPQIANAVGTGFIADPAGSVITADHVIFDEEAEKPYERLYAIRFTGEKHRYFRLIVAHRYRDGTKGCDLALLRPASPPDFDLPHLDVGQAPAIGGEVLIAGFPLIFDKVYLHPLIRRGAVASTRYSYQGHSVLILDLPSVPGFSGSPVVNLTTGKVSAVLRGPPKKRRNTGFSVATLIDDVDLRPEE